MMKMSEILSERTRLWSQVKLDDLDLWRRLSVDEETKVAKLEEKNEALKRENERLLLLETEIKKMLTPDPNFKGTLPSWKPIKALLADTKEEWTSEDVWASVTSKNARGDPKLADTQESD